MNPVLMVCGGIFALVGVSGLVAPMVSERRRRTAEILGNRPWHQLALVAAGLALAVGGALDNWLWVGAGVVGLVVVAVIAKRTMAAVEDPPPMMARAAQRSLNPLPSILHPIREARARDDGILKLRRNQREHREWEERRGPRPPREGPGTDR